MAPPIQLFFSFSHVDDELRITLEKHLALLRREGRIAGWHFRRIVPGRDWEREIDQHLEDADMILLLVSPDFISSDYCYDIEMQRALERHHAGDAVVIPIILRDCDWRSAPFARLQALPSDARPVTSWPNRDEAFADVARGVRAAAEDVLAVRTAESASRRDRRERNRRFEAWNLQRARNPRFTGRTDILSRLEEDMESALPNVLTLRVLSGLAGSGKSTIAVELAYRLRVRYPIVWWIRCDDAETLGSDFAGLGTALGIPLELRGEQGALIRDVRAWLESTDLKWLLIFDNADTFALIEPYIPQPALVPSRIVVTSQNPSWQGVGDVTRVGGFAHSESVDFLLSRTGLQDRESASDLASLLGDLPLALEHAAAYIEQTGRGLPDYAALFASLGGVIPLPVESAAQPASSALEAIRLSIHRVRQQAEIAYLVLLGLSFHAPDATPLEVLNNEPARALEFDKATALLCRYSLIRTDYGFVFIHSLTQLATISMASERELVTGLQIVLATLNSGFPEGATGTEWWPTYAVILPHALAASAHAERMLEDRGSLADSKDRTLVAGLAARLLNQMGTYLLEHGDYASARDVLRRSVSLSEIADGPHAACTSDSRGNLGVAYLHVGDLQSAREQLMQAVADAKAARAANDITVGRHAGNLANVFRELGDLDKALEYSRLSLEISLAVYGRDHPAVAHDLNDIGLICAAVGDVANAGMNFTSALRILRKTYGPAHRLVAVCESNLAVALARLGKLQEARTLIEKAYRTLRDQLGEDHPETIGAKSLIDQFPGEGGKAGPGRMR